MAAPTPGTRPHAVVTRFAPSPTGALHVGGARTALFAWAFARQHGERGRFILRIEDTDRTRSSAASTRGVLRDLDWLGLNWDEGPDPAADDPYAAQIGEHGPYFQSQRLELYREQAKKLVAAGLAYEQDGAVRFRFTEDVRFRDEVYGDIEVKREQLEDMVILKSDGYATFHLAVVVDDALMVVTHVIRGQEHLSNTSKHVALQKALGYPTPVYVHLPSIMSDAGGKMSKRDKAKVARAAAQAQSLSSVGFDDERYRAFLAKENDDADLAVAIAEKLGLQLPEIEVNDFRRSGYLPEVLLNYLALLGWNPGGDAPGSERFDVPFIVERFGLDRINKGNSKFDRVKLAAFNQEALAKLPPTEFERRLREHLQAYHPEFLAKLGSTPAGLAAFAAAYQPRAKTLEEPVQAGAFFVAADDAIAYDAKAVEKNLAKNDGYALLRELADRLRKVEPWSGQAAHDAIAAMSGEKAIGMGKIAQPLRVAVTGNTVSPPIDVTLEILGKRATIARIERCIAMGAASTQASA